MAVTFQQEDFDYILDKVDHVKAVTPQYYLYGTAEGPKGNFSANGNAGNPGQQYTFSDPIIRGRYFNESEYYNASKVCIITKSSAILLFGTDDVLGMSFDLSLYGVTQELTIVGIRDDNQSRIISMMNGADSVQIEMPITTLGAYYNFYIEDFDSFYVVAEKAEYSKEVATKCISLLETRHNARGQGKILLQSFSDYTAQYDTILSVITLFISFVAGISLLVGGIGVMNIMLVSVTERTREIGIRKALGARTKSVLIQFLAEAGIITLLGGIIGILVGGIGAFGIGALLGIPTKIQVSTVIVATIFSSFVGIFFGIYPAKKAARLSPIEALRHE